MSRTTVLATLAAIATVSLLATAPAEAGRRTGSWKYSPEEVWAYQQYQNEMAARQSWHARRHQWGGDGYGEGYGGGYGRPAYGRPAYGWNGGYADEGGPAYGEYGQQGYPHRPAWDD